MVSKSLKFTVILIALSVFSDLSAGEGSNKSALRGEALAALRTSIRFYHKEVATHGGYVWRYSADLAKREGEGMNTRDQVLIQPPGTPTVGMAFLSAYEATGDADFLAAAKDAAMCVVKSQIQSGGWRLKADFDPEKRKANRYRTNPEWKKASNWATFDDDSTQAALQLLMRVDKALDFREPAIHEAALFALGAIRAACYPVGAWPQWFEGPVSQDLQVHPLVQATPSAGSLKPWPGYADPEWKYTKFYTLNDSQQRTMIRSLLEAASIYSNAEYRTMAERAGDFLLRAQLPEPQPGWAQQYNFQMQPDWGRKFEPPSVCSQDTQDSLWALMDVCRATKDRKYLRPIPRALAYLKRSPRVTHEDQSHLAMFYELRSNRILYINESYEVVHEPVNVITHYAMHVPDETEAIAAELNRLQSMPDAVSLAATKNPPTDSDTWEVIRALDQRGAWVQPGRLPGYGNADDTRSVITSETFAKNVNLLSSSLVQFKAGR